MSFLFFFFVALFGLASPTSVTTADIKDYVPNGTNASWPHRTDFVRATMAECERISNLTGGKPIIPQCNYQYFVSPRVLSARHSCWICACTFSK